MTDRLSSITVDVESRHDGTYDVWIGTEGGSGSHYPSIAAQQIGDNVADLVDTLEEAYSGKSFLTAGKRYMLIATDGFSIDHTIYASYEEAYVAMKKAYEDSTPAENDESSEEMSSLGEWSAILYANGENVFCWDIAEI